MKTLTRKTLTLLNPAILPFLIIAGLNGEAAILFTENFETDGLDVRYSATGNFTDGADDYFTRTDGSTEASGVPGYTGFEGSYFWAAEDIDATENTAGVALLDFSGISLGGFPAIQISLDMGAGSGSAFDSVDDFVLVQYRVDAGSWSTALAFQNNGQVFNGPLLVDTDFDSIGDGITLGLQFQTITSAILPVSGSFMDLRIDTLMTSNAEAIGFDNIQVISVPEPNTTALFFSIASLVLMLGRRLFPLRENESRA